MPSINTNTIAVLFDEQNITIEGLIRNLINFEFCMQNNTTFKQPGSIYLIDTDRNIFLRERNGSLIEMERWKQPQKLSNAFEQNWANSTLFSS